MVYRLPFLPQAFYGYIRPDYGAEWTVYDLRDLEPIAQIATYVPSLIITTNTFRNWSDLTFFK